MPSNPVVAVRSGVVTRVSDGSFESGADYIEAEIHFYHRQNPDGQWIEDEFVGYQKFFLGTDKQIGFAMRSLGKMGVTMDGEDFVTNGQTVEIHETQKPARNGKVYPEYLPPYDGGNRSSASEAARAKIAAAFAQANALQEANAPNTAPSPPPPPHPAAATASGEEKDDLPF